MLLLSGCGASRTMLMQDVRKNLEKDDATKALETYKKTVKQTENVDELLNLGLLEFEAGNYQASFTALSDAERLSEERLTKSLSREAAGVVVNDLVRAYQGTVFDKAMLHYYRALGFLAQHDVSSATVEGRAIAHYLEVNARESTHSYKDDAFLQYFSGALYEDFGQVNDAWISYKRAAEIYKDYYGLRVPTFLCPVTLSAVRRVGDADAEKQLDSLCCDSLNGLFADYGRVIVLCEVGLAPPIRESNIVLPILRDDPHSFADDGARRRYAHDVALRRGQEYHEGDIKLDYFLRVALPYYDDKYVSTGVNTVAIRDTTGLDVPAEPGQNIGAILRQDLRDREGAILARAVVRGLIKYAATKAAKEAGGKEHKLFGDLLGTVVNAVGVATEAADTRSWDTLPDRIFVADIRLSPGAHHLRAVFRDELGSVLFRKDFDPIDLKRGDIVFLRARCMR